MEAVTKKLAIFFVTFGTCFAGLIPIHPALYSAPALNQYYASSELQNPYSQFYYYHDLRQANPGLLAASVYPVFHNVPSTYNYYGTPVYDFRYPLTPVVPDVTRRVYPHMPANIPVPDSKPENPNVSSKGSDDTDTIEKLDMKIAPETKVEEAAVKTNFENNDSITIEAVDDGGKTNLENNDSITIEAANNVAKSNFKDNDSIKADENIEEKH